jgi:hypothetical protein
VPGAPFGIAAKLDVFWSEATESHTLRLELVDSDGTPFVLPVDSGGTEPVILEHSFTTGIPAGVKPGTPIDHVFAANFIGLPLEPNKRYEWRTSIDGHLDEDWCLAFNTAASMTPPAETAH